MATISVGNIKFNWKGAWSNSTTYAVDDVVSLSGSSYISIQAGSNQNPASASAYWQQMSSAGTNGTDLTSTLTTRGDIVFKGASALERLAKGSTGQVLKQGANDPEWGTDAGGSVRKVSMFNDATYNITTSNASVSFPITIDFVKDQADSDLFVFGWTPVALQASHLAGMRMRLQKTSDSSYASETDNEAYGGQVYVGMPSGSTADDQRGIIHWSRRIDTSSETFFNSAETYRIHLGWSSRDGSNQRPSEKWNPQHTSARHRQNSTQIWVWEIDPTKSSFIT